MEAKQVVEHAWMFYGGCILLGGGFLWLFKRYIDEGIAAFKEVKESVKDLYTKYDETRDDIKEVDKRISKLEGEHNIMVNLGGHK